MEKLITKIVPGPHVYDRGIIYQDAGIQPHIAMMATYFDQETRDDMGKLYAASPLLLSALIQAVEVFERHREIMRPHLTSPDCYPDWYHEAKAAIAAAGVVMEESKVEVSEK